jgi:hypothetical protein
MKKFLFSLILACSLSATSSIYAQNAATTKGDVLLDVGVGFFGGYYDGYQGNYYTGNGPGPGPGNNWNYNHSSSRIQIPALSVTLQKAFWNDVTLGGQIAFNMFGSTHDLQQNDGYYQHSKYVQTNMFFLGRGEYHFNRLIGWASKYDLYAGVMAGMRVTTNHESDIYEGWGTGQAGTWRNDYPNRSSTDVGPAAGVFGGMRYYFAKNTSVFGEVGIGLTNFRTGLNWRF